MTLEALDLVTAAAGHARHLRTLIGDRLEPNPSTSASKALMLAALQAAELDMLQTIALVAPADRDRLAVCGHWTLHDLVGHLADWDNYFLDWLETLIGTPPPARYWDDDGDRFNAWLNEQRQGQPWAQAWADFRINRQRLCQQLVRVPEKSFLRQDRRRRSAPFPSVYHCAWSALEHYLDHAAGVRRQLACPVPGDLLQFHGPYTD
jgi:hypothetical protein